MIFLAIFSFRFSTVACLNIASIGYKSVQKCTQAGDSLLEVFQEGHKRYTYLPARTLIYFPRRLVLERGAPR